MVSWFTAVPLSNRNCFVVVVVVVDAVLLFSHHTKIIRRPLRFQNFNEIAS